MELGFSSSVRETSCCPFLVYMTEYYIDYSLFILGEIIFFSDARYLYQLESLYQHSESKRYRMVAVLCSLRLFETPWA